MKINIPAKRFGHKVFYGRLVPWLKIWMWGGDGNGTGEFSFPNDAIIKQCTKYVPKKPVTLFRSHDNSVPDTVLQSWTHYKWLAEDLAGDDPKRAVISKTFNPDRVLIDVSLIDKTVQEQTLEHTWAEVIILNGEAVTYVAAIRNGKN